MIGRSLALTEDGLLHLGGLYFLGQTKVLGYQFLWRSEPDPVPIGSVEVWAGLEAIPMRS